MSAIDLAQETSAPGEAKFSLDTSRNFAGWMADQGISLGFTTYQSAKLFLVGLTPESHLSVHERTFNRCMGLWGDGETLWMSSLYQLWRFRNVLGKGETHNGHDRLYVPMTGYTTGDVDIHDLAVDAGGGAPVFVVTLASCLATVSETGSFRAIWRPPFISRLALEDRCHLNGMALRDGRPAYVTAVAHSDIADGWREHRRDGGIVIDVDSGEIVASGLSMPHSPRLHGGTLYLLDSGTGRLGRIDPASGRFDAIAFCPGYLRGLAFSGDYALVGLSRPRNDDRTFAGLALGEELARYKVAAKCGLMVIDLRSGDCLHHATIGGVVRELYDVIVLPEIRRPMALGFKSDEIRRTIRFD